MNDSKNKRVILINGDNSKWYEQAIFIVKKNIPEKHIPMDFVAEAEKVVNSYMLKTAYRKTTSNTSAAKKKSSEGVEMLISILIIIACISLVVILFLLM